VKVKEEEEKEGSKREKKNKQTNKQKNKQITQFDPLPVLAPHPAQVLALAPVQVHWWRE